MNAYRPTAEATMKADRTAARLTRIVIIGMVILEAIGMAAAFFSKLGHSPS